MGRCNSVLCNKISWLDLRDALHSEPGSLELIEQYKISIESKNRETLYLGQRNQLSSLDNKIIDYKKPLQKRT